MLSAIVDLATYWGPYVLYGTLYGTLTTLATLLYNWIRRRLDAQHADDLPEYPGEWIKNQLRDRGLEHQVSVVPSPKGGTGNAFMPSRHCIYLSSTTYYKNNPVHLAIAAHELGHALLDAGPRLLASLFLFARVFGRYLAYLAAAFLCANIFYGLAWISDAGFKLMAVSVVFQCIVILEEGAVSTHALRMLRQGHPLRASQWLAALVTLCSALATYIAGAVGSTLLLIKYSELSALVAERVTYDPATALGGWRLWVCGALTVIIFGLSVRPAYEVIRPRRTSPELSPGDWIALRFIGLPMGALVWMVWDQPLGASWVGLVALASLSIWSSLRMLLSWLVILIAAGVGLTVRLVKRVVPDSTEPEPISRDDENRAQEELHSNKFQRRALRARRKAKGRDWRHYDAIDRTRLLRPDWVRRLGYAVALIHLPAVLYFWIQR